MKHVIRSTCLVLSALICGLFGEVHSQAAVSTSSTASGSVISAANGTGITSTAIVNWTLGEVAVGSYGHHNGSLTEGFHQPVIIVAKQQVFSVPKFSAKLYPNPASDLITVDFEAESISIQAVEIISSTGQVVSVSEFEAVPNQIQLDVSGLPIGGYFVRILDQYDAIMSVHKFLKIQ